MKIILTQNMGKLGSHGDEVEVKAGYARNYLVPKGFAVMIHHGKSKMLTHQKKLIETKRQEEIQANKDLAAKLSELNLVITAKAAANGKLFGSITSKMIIDKIIKEGISVDKKSFILNSTIKQVGNHTLPVQLHSQVVANLSVKVVSSEPQIEASSEEKPQTEDQSADQVSTTNTEDQDSPIVSE